MTQTILTKGRSLFSWRQITTVLLAVSVALMIGLAGTPATSEAATDPLLQSNYDVFNPNYDPLTGLPWWATYTPSNAAMDAGISAPETYPMLDINEELARLGLL